MRRLSTALRLALLLLLASGFARPATQSASQSASQSATQAAAELPIQRVVLYKNGVGYFEHRGHVTANQELNIRFTTAQLNDVLKSLTVVDLNGGKVGGVRYNSVAPLSQRLGSMRLALDGNTDRTSFLNALRGARVEVHALTSAGTGRLLSVEELTRQDKDGNTLKSTQISLVSDSGELRTFDLTPATSVRILESEMTREVSHYMELLASARDQDVRQMTISTNGEGSREIVVSYISEVPVWKSTYRIVLPESNVPDTGVSGNGQPPSAEGKPLLQGWAIVDNTVGEDWRNVQLSLVAGAPQSFVEQISQPYYVRRPVVELPKTVQLAPQTHEGAEYQPAEMDNVANGVSADVSSAQAAGAAGGALSAAKKSFAASGIHQADKLQTPAAAPAPLSYEQSFQPQSSGEALGDMFEYAIHQNVTVLQNQSALVPIVQARVDAEKVTLWNAREPVPVRALWLTNSSGLTLDAGTFNIVEGGAFAGEGLLTEIRPNERRLLSYAADTAVRVKAEGASEQRPYTRLRAARGILSLTRELRETRTYTISNSDIAGRSVIIEHPARSGWHFLNDLKPEESSGSYYRFRVRLPPASTEKLEVAEYFPQETTYALTTLDDNTIGFILKTNGIQPEIETALRNLLAKKDEIASIEGQIQERRDEVASIGQEQSRIRENMKSLKGTPEEKTLLQRYVASLNQQEDRLTALNSEISAKEVELNARQREYQQTAELMSFDQTR
jgi:hypothetical protein